jgi:ribonucleoside-diphosphate reductase alpha chain
MPLTLTHNARRVLEARYLLRDGAGRRETPEQLFARVATAVAHAESAYGGTEAERHWQREFQDALIALDFLPNSPTLMNAGTPMGQLSACFVIPVDDTMEGIFEALKQMALVQRTGGGTGFSFSRLRPAGDVVSATQGEASGPVSFMRIFDSATENIRQGGKRRGANMGVLRVDHPDVMRFIEAKLDGDSLQNFNLSVAATDAFMERARAGASYGLIDPRSGEERSRANAAEVFEAIAQAAWRTGDPGLLFIDAINRANPTPHKGVIESTNPCGEVPLLPWEACNLGSLNLSHVVIDGRIDHAKLERMVRLATRFLDDVIDVNRYPGAEFQRPALGNRKIGLGVMGFAEMLIELGVSYDSDEAVRVAQDVMARIRGVADETSAELAEERGVYPWWPGSVHEAEGMRFRNATRTSIAPTGTIGIIAGTTASIEPMFALAYRRHALDGQTLVEVNPLFARHLADAGLDVAAVTQAVADRGGLSGLEGIPDPTRERFVTALDIPWQRHLEVQAAFQRHVDNSVSKTINMPHDATPADIRSAYELAWEKGLKGITVYRYGSKETQVLELGLDQQAIDLEHSARCDPEECRM